MACVAESEPERCPRRISQRPGRAATLPPCGTAVRCRVQCRLLAAPLQPPGSRACSPRPRMIITVIIIPPHHSPTNVREPGGRGLQRCTTPRPREAVSWHAGESRGLGHAREPKRTRPERAPSHPGASHKQNKGRQGMGSAGREGGERSGHSTSCRAVCDCAGATTTSPTQGAWPYGRWWQACVMHACTATCGRRLDTVRLGAWGDVGAHKPLPAGCARGAAAILHRTMTQSATSAKDGWTVCATIHTCARVHWAPRIVCVHALTHGKEA